jgi:hypothetical protein
LITKSFETSPNIFNYLKKRIARIFPAFVVATIVSIFLFAPLSGTDLAQLPIRDWMHVIIQHVRAAAGRTDSVYIRRIPDFLAGVRRACIDLQPPNYEI